MLLDLNDEDLKMLKDEMEYIRCMYWDNKIKTPKDYCDGECHGCTNKMKFDKYIESKIIK